MANIPVRGPLFSPEWQARYAPVIERSMIASGTVYRPNNDPDVYDSDTDTWVPAPREVVYSGKMRVQPLRTASKRDAPGNTTEVQTFLFSVPHTVLGDNLRPGMIVEVDNGGLNPDLLGFDYRVVEVTDSSNPLEKTFYAVVNQERELTPTPELITYRWLGEPYASPSQEVAPDATVLRTNLALNPNPAVAGNGLWTTTSAMEITGPGEFSSIQNINSRAITPYVHIASDLAVAHLNIRTTLLTDPALQVGVYGQVSGGSGILVDLIPNVSVESSAYGPTAISPLTVGFGLLALTGPIPQGTTIRVDSVMVQVTPDLTPPVDTSYFDGNTPPRPV